MRISTLPSLAKWRLSLPHLLSALALFVALGGTALATHPGGANTISSGDIITGEVKSVDLGNGEVKTDDLAANSVGSGKIADRQVKNADLSIGASSSNTIADGGIEGVDVHANTLTGDQIAESALFNDDSLDGADVDESTLFNDHSLTGLDVNQASLTQLWQLGGNTGTDPSFQSLGTTDNAALTLSVNSAQALRLEPAGNGTSPSPNVIGGSSDNTVTEGVFAATIGGGGRDEPFSGGTTGNRVTDNFGTVGGGTDNQAGDPGVFTEDTPYATVGGGQQNLAAGIASTVGGGSGNSAFGDAPTVAGGTGNSAYGPDAATVGGGSTNAAGGTWATVPGGVNNVALGTASFAAGGGANAAHAGSFVWADGTDSDADQVPDTISSTAANQFIARAAGRFFLQSDSTLANQGGFLNTSTGAFLSTGGDWTNNSDRRLKHRFAALRPSTVLRKLTRLPVRSWSYKAEPGVRHIGPVAQDFHRVFRVGADERHIGTVDEAGVALAAIKALAAQNRRLNRRIARLERG
jgi:Chaperone of endosialidase